MRSNQILFLCRIPYIFDISQHIGRWISDNDPFSSTSLIEPAKSSADQAVEGDMKRILAFVLVAASGVAVPATAFAEPQGMAAEVQKDSDTYVREITDHENKADAHAAVGEHGRAVTERGGAMEFAWQGYDALQAPASEPSPTPGNAEKGGWRDAGGSANCVSVDGAGVFAVTATASTPAKEWDDTRRGDRADR